MTDRFKLIANYSSHFNNQVNGKGLALFFRSRFTPVLDVKEDGYQMSKLESKDYVFIDHQTRTQKISKDLPVS